MLRVSHNWIKAGGGVAREPHADPVAPQGKGAGGKPPGPLELEARCVDGPLSVAPCALENFKNPPRVGERRPGSREGEGPQVTLRCAPDFGSQMYKDL